MALAPLLYNLALLLASPLLALYLLHRIVMTGKSRQGLRERLGWAPRLGPPPPAGRVWLQAVSAGEMVAAAAIARRLAEAAPEVEIVVSATTPAGREQAERLIPGAAARCYFPFDFLPCVGLALLRLRPTVVAAVETELWPNWLWLAGLLGARRALVSGQIADRGYRGARRFRWLYGWILRQPDALWMQTERAADRALELGAPPEQVRVVGSVKFEQAVPPVKPELEALVRGALDLGPERPLWIAGSTHPGEEEQVLEAFAAARAALPGLALLLAPRHVQRAPEVAALLRQHGWRCALRSEAVGTGTSGPLDVLVLDTMGELGSLYALAQVVFVGGSLVPVGGHDVLQPLFQRAPVLFGPHMHNQHDLARLVLESGAGEQVANASELADRVRRLCAEPALRKERVTAGQALLAANAGAARECAALLARLAARSGE